MRGRGGGVALLVLALVSVMGMQEHAKQAPPALAVAAAPLAPASIVANYSHVVGAESVVLEAYDATGLLEAAFVQVAGSIERAPEPATLAIAEPALSRCASPECVVADRSTNVRQREQLSAIARSRDRSWALAS